MAANSGITPPSPPVETDPTPVTPRKRRRSGATWAMGGSLTVHALFLLALWQWPEAPGKPREVLLEVDLTQQKPEVVAPTPKPTPVKSVAKPKPVVRRVVRPRIAAVPRPRVVPPPAPKPVVQPTPIPQPTARPEPTAIPQPTSVPPPQPTAKPEPTAKVTPPPAATPPPPSATPQPKPARSTNPRTTPSNSVPDPGRRPAGTQGGAPARRFIAKNPDTFAGGRSAPAPGGGSPAPGRRRNNNEQAGGLPDRAKGSPGGSRGRTRRTDDDPFALTPNSGPAGDSAPSPNPGGPARRYFARRDNSPEALPDGNWSGGPRSMGGLPGSGGVPTGSRRSTAPDVAGGGSGGGVGRGSGSGAGEKGRGRRRGGGGDDPFAGYGGTGGGGGNGSGGSGPGTGGGPGGPGRGTLLVRRGNGDGTGDGNGSGPGSGTGFGRGPLGGIQPGLGGSGGGTGTGRGRGNGGRGGEDAGTGDDIAGSGRGARSRTRGERDREGREGEDEIGRGIWGGFKIRYYQDSAKHPDLPDATFGPGNPIDWPVFSKLVTTVTEPNMNFNWGERSPAPGVKNTFWSMKAAGRIFVPKDDTYEFFFDELDDAGSLSLDGKEIIKIWKVQKSSPSSGKMFLKRGPHDLRIEYIQGPATEASIRLSWRSTSFTKEIVGVYKAPEDR